MTIKFFRIKNQTKESADIYFYGDIVSDEWEKWTDTDTCPDDVLKVLDEVKDVKQLNIYINSGGGSVFAGLAIYNMLKRHQAYKTVYVDGLAASISSVIALAGDKVIIPSNAFLMIHKPWSWEIGNANDMRKMADDLDRVEEGIINVYAENMAEGADIETIKQMVNEETWLNGVEASKYFKVEVTQSNQAAACIKGDSLKHYNKIPSDLEIKDSIENNQENEDLELIKLQLQLLA